MEPGQQSTKTNAQVMFTSREDKILVIGAHWDTTGFTDGYNDNGSGKT